MKPDIIFSEDAIYEMLFIDAGGKIKGYACHAGSTNSR